MKTTDFIHEDFRICIIAFSKQYLQVTIRDRHSNERLSVLVMSNGILYGNEYSLRFTDLDLLKDIRPRIQSALEDWENWETVPSRAVEDSIVLY